MAYAARNRLKAAGLTGGVTISGGGTQSLAWRQVLADVLKMPLRIARTPEVGARGAAMGAMIAAGKDFERAAGPARTASWSRARSSPTSTTRASSSIWRA